MLKVGINIKHYFYFFIKPSRWHTSVRMVVIIIRPISISVKYSFLYWCKRSTDNVIKVNNNCNTLSHSHHGFTFVPISACFTTAVRRTRYKTNEPTSFKWQLLISIYHVSQRIQDNVSLEISQGSTFNSSLNLKLLVIGLLFFQGTVVSWTNIYSPFSQTR